MTLEEKLDAVLNDSVSHPAHYCRGNIEVIDFIEDQQFPYHLGNAVKYLARAGHKDPAKTTEDLRKAVWYINRYIELLEKNSGSGETRENGENGKQEKQEARHED